jgi:hypothetical protein
MTKKLLHKFVTFIPDHLEDGIIYISMEYAVAIHKCCCGCGNEVVTPLSPTDWKLTFDGETISLYPSIGNWNFKCQSHYWIKNNEVEWAPKWTKEEIERGRKIEEQEKIRYYKGKKRRSLMGLFRRNR